MPVSSKSIAIFLKDFSTGVWILSYPSCTVEHMFEGDRNRDRTPQMPAGLFEEAPGPVAAAYLKTMDVAAMSGHDLILLAKAANRMISHYQALLYQSIAAVTEVIREEVEDDLETAHEAAGLELRAAMRWTRRAADIELDTAHELFSRLPAVGQALTAGEIDLKRARVITYGTSHLEIEQANTVADTVLEQAPGLTTGQLAARVRKLCIAIQPDEAKQRYETALEQRRLVKEANTDGTTNLMLFNVSPKKAEEAFNRVNHLAQSLHVKGETRTIDQLRADVALDLLRGRSSYKMTGRGTVTVHTDLKTLVELADEPGELAGYGPVIADIARQIAEAQTDAEWRYRVTNEATGQPLHVGTTSKRRHNTTQKRAVELRDLTCVFPGCRMPATSCDIDHIKTWVDTHRTSATDSAPGCRHDHVGRHKFGWTYHRLPNGDYLWTSPLGHTHTTSGRSPPK